MRQRVDTRLLDEIRARALRFTCPDCLYFLGPEAGGAGGSCAHFWPNGEHLAPPSEPKDHVVFCKEFDLR